MTKVMSDRILTVKEVAAYLKLTEATIYQLAQTGEIPAKRVGRSWRFSQAQIQEWFTGHVGGEEE